MMRKRSFLSMVTSVCCLLWLAGCGYTTRSMMYGDKYRTIYIKPFVNKIDITLEGDAASKYKINRPMLDMEITKSVVNRFLFDGNLRPAKTEDADLILKGELVEFRRDPLRYTEGDDVEEYRMNIIVNLSLWDAQSNTLLWKEDRFIGDTTYFTSFSTSNLKKSDATAINDAVTDLSRRIVERTVEQW